MAIKFNSQFRKQYKKASQKIRIAFQDRLKLFRQNSYHPQLNNHALTGKLKGCRSINVTGDWRAIFSEHDIKKEKVIIFELLGTHSQLYK